MRVRASAGASGSSASARSASGRNRPARASAAAVSTRLKSIGALLPCTPGFGNATRRRSCVARLGCVRKIMVTAAALAATLAPLGDPSYTPARCAALADTIAEIAALKRARNAVVLAHNYQRPEIFEVADFVGDSLELARQATRVDAEVIVFCGVHFMAETAKILNPTRRVILPDLRAGCSLADSVTGEELAARAAALRAVHPDLAVVGYVNTTADVKAECDACCTSSNAVRVVEALPSEHILFVPDRNLAAYVHQQITPEQVAAVRRALPRVRILVHPECRTDVLALADAVLSTSGMVRYAKESPAEEFLIVTECGLSDRLLLEVPGKRFYKSCKLCQYMKLITLEATRDALRNLAPEVTVPEPIRLRAERALTRMLELGG